MCVLKKIVKTRENFRIYVQNSGPNSNFRTTPRPEYSKFIDQTYCIGIGTTVHHATKQIQQLT